MPSGQVIVSSQQKKALNRILLYGWMDVQKCLVQVCTFGTVIGQP
jgi:hypothetical protein